VLDTDPIPELPGSSKFEHTGFFVLLSKDGKRVTDDAIRGKKRAQGSLLRDFGTHAFERYDEAARAFYERECTKGSSACTQSAWSSTAAERDARGNAK
jgi:hypothetical protein